MIWNRRTCLFACVICLVATIIQTGCNNGYRSRGTASGQVKLDGKPIERGSILLSPMEGVKGQPAGGEITAGRYQLSGKVGPAIGWNRVEIHALRKTGRTIRKPFPMHGTMEEEADAVAPRYNTDSTLKFEVKPGENTADFEVSSK
jgi:hypothetical protein